MADIQRQFHQKILQQAWDGLALVLSRSAYNENYQSILDWILMKWFPKMTWDEVRETVTINQILEFRSAIIDLTYYVAIDTEIELALDNVGLLDDPPTHPLAGCC